MTAVKSGSLEILEGLLQGEAEEIENQIIYLPTQLQTTAMNIVNWTTGLQQSTGISK